MDCINLPPEKNSECQRRSKCGLTSTWWFDYVTMIKAWSLMFGPYVVWITAEGIYYRQSLQE